MGGWIESNNREIHNLCSSPYVIRVIKSVKMRWAEHVARMEEMRNAYLHNFSRKT